MNTEHPSAAATRLLQKPWCYVDKDNNHNDDASTVAHAYLNLLACINLEDDS